MQNTEKAVKILVESLFNIDNKNKDKIYIDYISSKINTMSNNIINLSVCELKMLQVLVKRLIEAKNDKI